MVKCMFSRLKSWLLGAFVAIAFALSVIGAFGQCSAPVPPLNGPRIDSIIVERVDTLIRLDTIRKTRIKYIDTSRIDTVHDMLDSLVPIDTADNDGNQMIAANQLREALRWKDSLNTCIEFRKVDSIALDTMSKIARTVPDTIKIKPPITQRLKDAGIGFLLGVATRSFF